MSLLNEPLVYLKENDMRYAMPWHRLAHFLGVMPFTDWKSFKFGVSAKTRLCLMILAATLSYLWMIYLKVVQKFYKDKTPAIAVMDVSSWSSLLFSIIVCLIELMFLKRKHLQTLLTKLDQVDANLKRTRFEIETYFWFYFKAICLHILLLTTSCLVIFHMTLKYDERMVLAFVAKEMGIYYVNILMVLTYTYSVCIGIRFKKLNLELKEVHFRRSLGAHIRVRRLAGIYCILLDVLHLFNLVFGWQLLALAMRVVMDTLFVISTGVFLISVRVWQMNITPTIVFAMKVVVSWVSIILLATSGNEVTRQIRKTVIINHKLMQDLRSNGDPLQTGLVHDELFLLTQKIISSSPHVNAGGFFPVDYKMLFACLSCVTLYLIVLIQFNK